MRPTANAVPVLVLQHPHEQRQAKGSARLLRLGLAQCTVQVGETFDPAWLAAWLRGAASPAEPGDGRQPLLLYPGGMLVPVAEAPAAGWRLVLIDGTWRQSRQMVRAHAELAALPRWPLGALPPSRYAARTAQAAHQRSTLEACCLALGALEGASGAYQPMLDAFGAWAQALARQFRRA